MSGTMPLNETSNNKYLYMKDNTTDLVAMYLEVYDTLQEHSGELGEVDGFAALTEEFNAAMAALALAIKELDEANKMEQPNSDIVVTLEDFEGVWKDREKGGEIANTCIAKINLQVGVIGGVLARMDKLAEGFAAKNPKLLAAYKAARVVKTKDGKGGDASTGK
jgi:hypothetical protein